MLVSDRWIRAAGKKALEGLNEVSLKRMTEAERKATKETLESSAANLAMASVRRYRAEVLGRGCLFRNLGGGGVRSTKR